jgi:hypothetical protein
MRVSLASNDSDGCCGSSFGVTETLAERVTLPPGPLQVNV